MSRIGYFAHWLSRVIVGLVCRVLLNVRLTGLENIPKHGGAILVSNHLTELDSIILPVYLWRRPIRFWAKSSLWRNKLVGRYLDLVVILKVRGKVSKESIMASRPLVRLGGLLGVFTEGGRVSDGDVHKGHPTAAEVAIDEKVPVIPIGHNNTERIRLLHPRTWRTRVEVNVGKPMYPDTDVSCRKLPG
jgi:1-acyl-sn-glycerol-3-phosphate acyltransferase